MCTRIRVCVNFLVKLPINVSNISSNNSIIVRRLVKSCPSNTSLTFIAGMSVKFEKITYSPNLCNPRKAHKVTFFSPSYAHQSQSWRYLKVSKRLFLAKIQVNKIKLCRILKMPFSLQVGVLNLGTGLRSRWNVINEYIGMKCNWIGCHRKV